MHNARSSPAIRGCSDRFTVPIEELLTRSFVTRHSRFESVEALLAASGLDPAALVDLDARSRTLWDRFARLATRFPDWDALLREAGAEWLIRRLGIAIEA